MKKDHASLFDFDDYRAYLKQAMPVVGAERGARVRLAAHLGCQSGFISQVMSGLAEFSLEHAIKISQFLAHGKEERNFFLLLVQLSRAGSKDLKEYFLDQIDLIRAKRRSIQARVVAKKGSLSAEDKMLYYSSWHYTAIHMCLANPFTQNEKAIVDYLNLPTALVKNILQALEHMGFATRKAGGYQGDYDRLHLPADSPLISKHHANWRMRAIQSLDISRPKNLHYSSVMSISATCAEEIRNLLLAAIQSAEPLIREAKDEGVFTFNLDLFENKF